MLDSAGTTILVLKMNRCEKEHGPQPRSFPIRQIDIPLEAEASGQRSSVRGRERLVVMGEISFS